MKKEEEMVPLSLFKSILSNFDWIRCLLGMMVSVRGARTNWAVADARGFQSTTTIPPQQCSASPKPDQTGKNVRANLSPARLFSITRR